MSNKHNTFSHALNSNNKRRVKVIARAQFTYANKPQIQPKISAKEEVKELEN